MKYIFLENHQEKSEKVENGIENFTNVSPNSTTPQVSISLG